MNGNSCPDWPDLFEIVKNNAVQAVLPFTQHLSSIQRNTA